MEVVDLIDFGGCFFFLKKTLSHYGPVSADISDVPAVISSAGCGTMETSGGYALDKNGQVVDTLCFHLHGGPTWHFVVVSQAQIDSEKDKGQADEVDDVCRLC